MALITELPSKTTLQNTDLLVVDDGSHTYKMTYATFLGLIPAISSFIKDDTTGSISIVLSNGQTLTVTPHDPTKQNVLTFDDTPTSGSNNPVKSGGIYTSLGNKVDKEDGKGLSANDFTDTLKDKLDGIESGAQVNSVTSVAGRTGDVTLAKADVGLGNVDNTSDANKPVSNATQTALNAKLNTSDFNKLGLSVVNGRLCQTYTI